MKINSIKKNKNKIYVKTIKYRNKQFTKLSIKAKQSKVDKVKLESEKIKTIKEEISSMHTFNETGAGVPAFLAKLWRLVDDPETNNLICWSKVSVFVMQVWK